MASAMERGTRTPRMARAIKPGEGVLSLRLPAVRGGGRGWGFRGLVRGSGLRGLGISLQSVVKRP